MALDGFARDLRDAFLEFPIPTLIIEGEYDANWGADKPRLLSTQHPNSELVVIPSAAHFPFAEQPGAFFSELERFVRTAEPISYDAIRRWKQSVEGF